jgi:hypothetical protein
MFFTEWQRQIPLIVGVFERDGVGEESKITSLSLEFVAGDKSGSQFDEGSGKWGSEGEG